MPIIEGFDHLASVPEEQITDKIGRRVISGKQGTMVYWSMKAGAHVAAHQHPHEQFVWVIKGTIRFRIGARGADHQTGRHRRDPRSRRARSLFSRRYRGDRLLRSGP